MGIPGLLPLLRPVTSTSHLREHSGQHIAVDASAWLHRAYFASGETLMMLYIEHIDFMRSFIVVLFGSAVMAVLAIWRLENRLCSMSIK